MIVEWITKICHCQYCTRFVFQTKVQFEKIWEQLGFYRVLQSGCVREFDEESIQSPKDKRTVDPNQISETCGTCRSSCHSLNSKNHSRTHKPEERFNQNQASRRRCCTYAVLTADSDVASRNSWRHTNEWHLKWLFLFLLVRGVDRAAVSRSICSRFSTVFWDSELDESHSFNCRRHHSCLIPTVCTTICDEL